MKHSLALLVLFVALIAQSCSNEKIENDWTRDNLQGKVMSYSEFSYEAKDRFGNIEKGKQDRHRGLYYFDDGNKYDEKKNIMQNKSVCIHHSITTRHVSIFEQLGIYFNFNNYLSDY